MVDTTFLEHPVSDTALNYTFLDLDAAYRLACKEGSKEVFLARMNLVGFHEAGKTSLAKRLMGKDFDANVKSTDGISLHYIKSTFQRNNLTGKQWNEADIRADELNKEVIEKMKQLGDTSEVQESNENRSEESENVQAINSYLKPFQKIFQRLRNYFSKKKAEDVATPGVPEFSMSDRFKELASANFDIQSNTTSEDNVPYTLRLWDLGGQNDFLTTHHLFLDVDATTVIVMDITKDFKEKFKHPDKDLKLKQSNPSSPEEIMHYWLNSFYTEAKEMERKTNTGILLNIFVVLTHIDDFAKNERQEKINMYKNQIMKSLTETKYAYFLTEEKIFAVYNKAGKEESFQSLREQLFKSFRHQQSWNQTMPVKWLRLQAEILEKKEKATKFMHIDHLEEMGRKCWHG